MSTPKTAAPTGRRARTSQSIIGFTEAELGLFLALLFFLLSQVGRRTPPVTGAQSQTSAKPVASDSASVRNPRLAQLLSLARKLDSLDRSVRSAYAHDSVVSSKLARLQQERDSLTSLAPGAGASGVNATTVSSREVNARLVVVEREIALALMSRTETGKLLAGVSLRADSVRRTLDSLAPAVSQLISPTTVVAGSPPTVSPPPGSPPVTRYPPTSGGAAAGIAPNSRLRDTMAIVRALAGGALPPSPRAMAMGAGWPGSPGSPGSPGAPGSASGSGTGTTGGPGGAKKDGGGSTTLYGSYGTGGDTRRGGVAGTGGANGMGGLGSGPPGPRGNRALGYGIGTGSGTGRDVVGPGRSRQTPTCLELKVDSAAIAEVLISGPDTYTARGVTGSLQVLLKTLQQDLSTAKRYVCRHNITIRTAPNLAVNDYIFALNALLPYFNTELARPDGAK